MRYYTLSEAEESMPRLRRKIVDLQKLQAVLEQIEDVEMDFTSFSLEEDKVVLRMLQEYHYKQYQLYSGLLELEERGLFVKDLVGGRVNFYSRHNGKDIFLCWQIHEEHVSYWQYVAEDSGCKPIVELK